MIRPDSSSCEKYHERQCFAKASSSLGATPNGVVERLRGLVGELGVLDKERLGKEGEVGDTRRRLKGLVGEVIGAGDGGS